MSPMERSIYIQAFLRQLEAEMNEAENYRLRKESRDDISHSSKPGLLLSVMGLATLIIASIIFII